MAGDIGYLYDVQPGETLSSIAQKAYGNANLWAQIYTANKQVIGNDPNLITPGMQLYIISNPHNALIYFTTQSCTVTVTSLEARESPTTKSAIVASYPQGTVLRFTVIIYGEPVDENYNWGHSSTDGHYFWLGGTNHSQG